MYFLWTVIGESGSFTVSFSFLKNATSCCLICKRSPGQISRHVTRKRVFRTAQLYFEGAALRALRIY